MERDLSQPAGDGDAVDQDASDSEHDATGEAETEEKHAEEKHAEEKQAEEEQAEEIVATADADARGQLTLLLIALATTLIALAIITSRQSYDAYLCQTDDDCRGRKECIEGQCWNPEVWERSHSTGSGVGP